MLQNENRKAENIIRKSIRATTSRMPLQKAYILAGLLEERTGNPAGAVKAFDNYLRLNPANSDVLYLKARALSALGKTDESLNVLTESSWFGKFGFIQAADVYSRLAEIYASRDEKDKAQEYLTKALATSAGHAPSLAKLGEIQISKGEKPAAIATLRQAISADPNSVEAKLLLAKALLLRPDRLNGEKDISEAQSLASSVIDQSSSDITTLSAAELLIRAKIEGQKFEEARKLLSNYSGKFPSSAELQTLSRQLEIEAKTALPEKSADSG